VILNNMKSQKLILKDLFVERMEKILGEVEFERYKKSLETQLPNSIRCNTLKITPEILKERLQKKGWEIERPFKEFPEIFIVKNELEPGELGRALEHLLGYYYIQEISSMMPIIVLKPKPNELVLDLCASPGSKTTQTASEMKNTGTIIANDVSISRLKILSSNLEKCGVTNTIITRKDALDLCKKLKQEGFEFDKILLDAPCSGEGTLKSSPKTALMWNINTIKYLSKIQKRMIIESFNILKIGGEMIYSTCTHAPEENEEIIEFALNEFKNKIRIEKIKLPLKFREGIEKWGEKKFSKEIKDCCRIYPQDGITEGFFITKIKKIK